MRRVAPAVDVAIAVVLLVTGSAQLLAADHTLPVPLDLALAVCLTAPLAVRRRWPEAVLWTVTIGTVLGFLGEGAGADLLFMPPLLIASYTVGTRVDWPRSLSGPAALALLFAVGLAEDEIPPADLPVAVGIYVGPWLVGQLLRVRDRHVVELTKRAVRAEALRELDAAQAVAAERVRIARELHDVVSHGLSVITIQVQAVRRRLHGEHCAHSTEAADLAAVETAARQAMAEMRRMLGVLRTGDEPTSLAPQPGLDQLDALIAETRAAGIDVHLDVVGRRVPLPPGGDLTAYRIVQEALTNVRKHAGGASCVVRLDFTGDHLVISVVDDGPGAPRPLSPAIGHGLVGMRERANLYGGRFSAAPRADARGFAVSATLPVREPALS
ncbi:MAG TPA: sensor histidine kinase [Nocardioidaceae bacterium]